MQHYGRFAAMLQQQSKGSLPGVRERLSAQFSDAFRGLLVKRGISLQTALNAQCEIADESIVFSMKEPVPTAEADAVEGVFQSINDYFVKSPPPNEQCDDVSVEHAPHQLTVGSSYIVFELHLLNNYLRDIDPRLAVPLRGLNREVSRGALLPDLSTREAYDAQMAEQAAAEMQRAQETAAREAQAALAKTYETEVERYHAVAEEIEAQLTASVRQALMRMGVSEERIYFSTVRGHVDDSVYSPCVMIVLNKPTPESPDDQLKIVEAFQEKVKTSLPRNIREKFRRTEIVPDGGDLDSSWGGFHGITAHDAFRAINQAVKSVDPELVVSLRPLQHQARRVQAASLEQVEQQAR